MIHNPFGFKKHNHVIMGTIILAVAFVFHGGLPAHADTIEVTAKVSAVLPAQAPVITSPFDQQHFTSQDITVEGTCDGLTAYVNIFRNGILAGASPCVAGGFSTVLSLFPGTNTLIATAYNSTDDAGPSSTPVIAYYDLVPPTPVPPKLDTSVISVSYIDGVPFNPNTSPHYASLQPTISGRGPAGSILTITFSPTGVTCKTRVLDTGIWSCTLASKLAFGLYHVSITALTSGGNTLTGPSFLLYATPDRLGLFAPFGGIFYMTTDHLYKMRLLGQQWSWPLTIHGGTVPYQVTINWGDLHTETITNQTGTVTIRHRYDQLGSYIIIAKATDKNDAHTQLQLVAIAKGGHPQPTIDLANQQREQWLAIGAVIALGVLVATCAISILWPQVIIGIVVFGFHSWRRIRGDGKHPSSYR